jgi:hypothetical protein
MPELWSSDDDMEWQREWYKRQWETGRLVTDRRNGRIRKVETIELPEMSDNEYVL